VLLFFHLLSTNSSFTHLIFLLIDATASLLGLQLLQMTPSSRGRQEQWSNNAVDDRNWSELSTDLQKQSSLLSAGSAVTNKKDPH
jgi:hypothetical protein